MGNWMPSKNYGVTAANNGMEIEKRLLQEIDSTSTTKDISLQYIKEYYAAMYGGLS